MKNVLHRPTPRFPLRAAVKCSNAVVSPAARRLVVALLAGVVSVLAVLAATGLLTGSPVGAADNSDGPRLYCGAGITPATADQHSNWKGGVVIAFSRSEACPDPIPSAALPILRLAVATDGDAAWSLTRLGWLYAALIGLVTAVAAWAAGAGGPTRALVLIAPLAPLADPDFARFFISTFSEPAGLLGAYVLMCGATVLAVTSRRHGVERVVGLVLASGGGLLAATTKTAYLPLLLVAVALCLITAVKMGRAPRSRARWSDRVAGPVAAALVLLAAVGPVTSALDWQSRVYPVVNAHNVIFTMLLPEAGPAAAAAVGLPPGALPSSGRGDDGLGPELNTIPGWQSAIGDHPDAARRSAYRDLAAHPAALARAIGVAMQATRGSEIDYLLSAPLPGGVKAPSVVHATGSMGNDGQALRTWLDGMAAPWWSSLLAALGIAAGAAGLLLRPRNWRVAALTRVAGLAAVGAVGLAITAVLGDGFYEIAKHVWLAAYLLDVTLLALIGAVVVLGSEAVLRAVRASRADSSPGREETGSTKRPAYAR